MQNIFNDIWKNKTSRTILLLMVATIIFSFILSIKSYIYNVVTFMKVGTIIGMEYNNPASYDSGPYGFTEDSEKAHLLLVKGKKEILDEIEDSYQINNIPDSFFLLDKSKFHDDYNLNAKVQYALETQFFGDLALLCDQKFMLENSIINREARENHLNKRTVLPDEDDKNKKVQAIEVEEIPGYINFLINIDQIYLYPALQKKPDSMEIIEFRKKVLKAVCRPQMEHQMLMQAIDYIEYKTEKEVYQKLKNNQINDSELLEDNKYQSLKANKRYRDLLWDHFNLAYNNTKNTNWMQRKSINLYNLNRKPGYLTKHIESLLELSRISSLVDNVKIYNHLSKISPEAVSELKNEIIYHYALAETSFRAGINEMHQRGKYSELSGKHTTYILHEFDRTPNNAYYIKSVRLHFLISLYNE
ncbi:MAG: hypothetical protein ABUK01_12505 [Leptospirales bacterium]